MIGSKFVFVIIAFASVGLAQVAPIRMAPNRYALFLADQPVSARFTGRESLRTAEAAVYRTRVLTAQRRLRTELAQRQIQVTGSAATLLNAVFVAATPGRLDELKALPGVAGVVPLRRGQRHLNRATQLMNASTAWNALGGVANGGAGIKIAIIDSGIDQTHAAFQDDSLEIPTGYPICSGDDCAYTNNKVIVARSYVRQIAAGTDSTNPAADSHPDDYSPRDRIGHGTAVASAAAGVSNSGTVTFTGMAPKAYLGNYKVYGTSGVNDYPAEDIYIQALEDALADGMDIANFSSGLPALSGPLDSGSTCGAATGVACDPLGQAFESAAQAGLTIAVSAGNGGADGYWYPTLGSINTPAVAPSVIAVGATTNSHVFQFTVSVADSAADSSLKNITAKYGDSWWTFPGSIAAPLVDVTTLGDDGYACSALPTGSLTGKLVLLQRVPTTATCTITDQATNAQDADAAGIVFYMPSSDALTYPEEVYDFYGPVVMVSLADGKALKTYLAAHPSASVVLDSAGAEQSVSTYNQVAAYSSFGPVTGTSSIKPDLVAVGGYDSYLFPDTSDYYLPAPAGLYMAAVSSDPNAELYSSNGYAAMNGTSFSAPITAGAAALVKQAHPTFSPAEIKSALMNQAAQDTTSDTQGDSIDVEYIGAGRLDAGTAAAATVTAVPSAVSFGAVNSKVTLPLSQSLTIANHSSASVTLAVALVGVKKATGTTVAVDQQSLTLAASGATGASATLKVTLSGTVPTVGAYSGYITLTGGAVSMRIPYLFVSGPGVADNLVPIYGTSIDGMVGENVGAFPMRIVDYYGLGVANATVTFTSSSSGAMTLASVSGTAGCTPASSTTSVSCTTDSYGIAYVGVTMGTKIGSYTLNATSTGVTQSGYPLSTSVYIRKQPTITAAGVVNAASSATGLVPGSYITIYGTSLSDPGYTASAVNAILPMALEAVSVSFDVPSASLSLPGRMLYVSPTQISLQVPWELQGQTSAQVKVTLNEFSYGNVVTVPVASYAPAFFENSGVAAALDASYAVISSSNPAKRGQVVQLYLTGLGPVTNQPASGEPATSAKLSWTTATPVVTIGGQDAPVQFSGLAPGFAGLYQVNATVSTAAATGTQPVTISIGGQTATASTIPVQ
jgi:minor extracellular serine protease Vpr